MKRGFIFIIAIFIIFMSFVLVNCEEDKIAVKDDSFIPKENAPGEFAPMFMTGLPSPPTTCSIIWNGNCSEGPPESFKNTFDSCSTGLGGDENINEVHLNQTLVLAGNSINVTCDVMIWGIMSDPRYGCGYGWQGDGLNIFYRNSPTGTWVRKRQISQVYSCESYSLNFVPDSVDGVHQVRCIIAYRLGPNDACGSGDFYDNDDVNFSVYSEYISVTISGGAPIDFGSPNPGSNVNALNNPLVVTVDSNVHFDITTRANSSVFASETDSFPVSNMKWQTVSSPATPYSTSEATVFSDRTAGNFNLYHELSIPPGQKQGTYSAGIVLTAKKTA